jgi:hypothetical protein
MLCEAVGICGMTFSVHLIATSVTWIHQLIGICVYKLSGWSADCFCWLVNSSEEEFTV